MADETTYEQLSEAEKVQQINAGYDEKYGFHDSEDAYVFKSRRGLDEEVVRDISRMKGEPEWMLERRLEALAIFFKKPMPQWGGGGTLDTIDFDNIFYYMRASDKEARSWDDVPDDIKRTFDRLGIPEAEQKFLSGAAAQYESEVVYHNIKKDLEDKGVIFLSTDQALQEYPEYFKEYFGSVIPSSDNKFAALNTAVWSGGSFIYVPKGVKVDMPLQAYFRINAQNMGQFERTLIICDEDSWVHYVEGCFLAGARVRTRTGEKPIEAIKVGDEVMTHKGRFRKVYNTMERPYEGAIYHIRHGDENSPSLHVTEEHPFLVVRQVEADNGTFATEWLPAAQVKVGDYLVAPVVEPELALAGVGMVNGATHSALALESQSTTSYHYLPIRAIEIEEMETTVYNFAVEEDESYIAEGVVSHNCTAPTWSSESLHSAVVEIIVKKGARCRYTTIQNWATNVYNLVTKRAVCEEHATMEWHDANLGCLVEGSTVTTPNGIQTIESLEVGDEVLSYDEQAGELVFRKVLAKRFSGYQPVHTVSVGERKLQVTANHPFYSYTYNPDNAKKLGRYQLAYVRADHLTEAIIPRTSLDYGVPHQLQKPSLVTEIQSANQYASDLTMKRVRESRMAEVETTTDELMWLFGYWIGDGDIQIKEGNTEGVIRWAKVGFSTPRTDRARGHLMDTMTALVDAVPTERKDGYHLSWNSKELAEFFKLNGFDGKALSKRVPTWVWSLPESQRLAFVAGYLDADGHVQPSRRFSLRSANPQLLEDVASLLVTLGITSRLNTEFSEPRTVTIMGYECTAHGSYRLHFPLDERLLPFVSQRLREEAEACELATLEYNRKVGRSQIELPQSVEIVDVTVSEASAEMMPTWDIEVEGTGNFVSQGYIVHNSKLTMKYPAVYMMGPHAKGEILSIAFAGKGQHQDAGAKVIHAAPYTSSIITSKSISKDGGRAGYRGLVQVLEGAHGSKSSVVCDALILDEESRSDTYPYIDIREDDVSIGHEATVSKVGEEQLFYLMSRGIGEEEALSMIVSGFIEPVVKELPMEYAVEMNRLIQLEMEGSVG